MKKRMEKRLKKTLSTVRKSHSRMLAACRRRNSAQLESSRRGAGSIPPRLRISQTVLAASETPSPTNSPWIRRYPQPGFSRASRRTSSRTSPGVPGRPGRRCGYVQRRATSSRCQRSSVTGETKNDGHARRGSATKRRQQSPISRLKLRTPDLPLQHEQLVAQHEDLDLLLTLRPQPQHEQLQQPPQRPVQKRQHGASRTTHPSTADPTDTAPTYSAPTEAPGGRSQFPALTRRLLIDRLAPLEEVVHAGPQGQSGRLRRRQEVAPAA